jgi:Putative glycosyl hydrolase domain
VRRRRAALALVVLLGTGGFLAGALMGANEDDAESIASPTPDPPRPKPERKAPRPLPDEVRGVHVTVALASIPGKIQEYPRLPGLNTLEVDVKDENGELGFVPADVPLAREIGSGKRYYAPRKLAAAVHEAGAYLIGRVVVFEDPILSRARPALAIRTRDGGVWRNHAGLGWTNPYDRRVWDYNVAIGRAAARAGFDEIQFDYVRFPSDGPIENAVFPGSGGRDPGWTIVRSLRREAPPGGGRACLRGRVRSLGRARPRRRPGARPAREARRRGVSHDLPLALQRGRVRLASPVSFPGATVARSLADFRKRMRGAKAELIPWLEAFSFNGSVSPEHVRAQITAARRQGAKGFLLWNPSGVYTEEMLAPSG